MKKPQKPRVEIIYTRRADEVLKEAVARVLNAFPSLNSLRVLLRRSFDPAAIYLICGSSYETRPFRCKEDN